MQCKYGHTDLNDGIGIVAIVLDAQERFGTDVAVKIRPDGIQTATLRVAAEDGGFIVLSSTKSASGDRLKPGDLVVWLPGLHNPELGRQMGDERSGWIGLIMAKIAPESDPNTNETIVICRY